MKNPDEQARGNVLKKIIGLMGEQMANRSPKVKADVKTEDPPKEEGEKDDDCPFCDGEGCRRCK